MADNREKDINEVVKKVENLTDQQLDKVAGGRKNCPPGQVLVGNRCEKVSKNR
jgi:hypothetical protein